MKGAWSGPVLMMGAAQAVIWAALFYIFPIMLLRWEVGLGWARAEVALAFTLALACAAVASPTAGRIVDRGGARVMFPAAALGGAACLFALSLVEGKPAFFALWALIGLASAFCLYEPCFAFLTRVKGADAKGAITAVTLIAGFASTICFPLADWLAEGWGWRAALRVFALGAALIAAPLFWAATTRLEVDAAPSPAARAEDAAAARRAMGRPVFWLIAASMPLMALIHGMFVSHILPLLQDRGADAAAAVLAASLIGPSQVAARILMTMLAGRARAVALAAFCFLGMAVAAGVLIAFGAAGAGMFVFVGLMGASAGVISIARPLLTAELLGRGGFGAISGALATPYIAMSAAAPFAAALLWGAGGYGLMLAAALAAALAGAAAVLASPWLATVDKPGARR